MAMDRTARMGAGLGGTSQKMTKYLSQAHTQDSEPVARLRQQVAQRNLRLHDARRQAFGLLPDQEFPLVNFDLRPRVYCREHVCDNVGHTGIAG